MKKLKVWQLVLIDLVSIGVGLNLFALFHHVLHFEKKSEPVTVMTLETTPSTVMETALPSTEPEEEPTPDLLQRSGRWGNKFADKFTDGEVISTDTSYQSENISVTLTQVEETVGNNILVYRIAEIYISDLQYLKAGFANDEFRKGTEYTADIATRLGAVAAISGDHPGARQEGAVLRNGILYRETRFQDVCVIDADGVMKTYTDEEFDLETIKQNGAWQIWSFGPKLLENGEVMTEFNSDVIRNNPRSAIGYVEPGHYFFVQVDGRVGNLKGMTMQELSQLFHDLGCVEAYNLDGGQSAGIAWQGKLISYPYGRPVSDIIYIGE